MQDGPAAVPFEVGRGVKMADRRRQKADVAPAGGPQERLLVKDEENLHLMGRFFRAMFLNLLKDPGKLRILDKLDLVVAIDPPDHPDSTLTINFSSGQVILEEGIAPDTDIRLRCEPAVMMKLTRVPAGTAAVKFMRMHEGKALIARMRSGDLKIKGIVRHPLGMMRFADFLAPSVD